MKVDSSRCEIKSHLKAREGTYQKLVDFSIDETKSGSSITTTVRHSALAMPVVDVIDFEHEGGSVVYCTGKDVYHYKLGGVKSETYVDRRSYKGGALPSSLRICPESVSINPDYLLVAIGFTAGQLQIIDMMAQDETRRSLQKINDERTFDSGAVTVIQWLPGSTRKLLAANDKGMVYMYNINLSDAGTFAAPVAKYAINSPFPIAQHINERPGNPEQKLSIGSAPITAMEFAPCGEKLSIASRNGYCLIFKVMFNESGEQLNELKLAQHMRAYFGGFLCSSWSPSGRFLAAGGEDDLISVMNVETGKLVARCQGHRSWVASVAWDPYVDANVDSRLGSVGQDGILCLWELATDLMFPRRTRTFSESERINQYLAKNGIDPTKDEEITMLEPLTEKRVSTERLTHLSFHLDSFVMSSQDKENIIVKWARPGHTGGNKQKTADF